MLINRRAFAASLAAGAAASVISTRDSAAAPAPAKARNELKSSHVSLISHPIEIAGLILEAAGNRR